MTVLERQPGCGHRLGAALLALACLGAVAWLIETGRQPAVRWAVLLPDQVLAAPQIVGDQVVVCADDAVVRALSLAGGGIVWERSMPASPAVDLVAADDRVLVARRDARLLAVAVDDGQVIWEQPLAAPLTAPPTLLGDCLLACDESHRLEARRLSDGALLWHADLGFALTAGPVLAADGIAVVGLADGRLLAWQRDGSLAWQQRLEVGPARGLSACDDGLWVRCDPGQVIELSAATGRSRRTVLFSRPLIGAAVRIGGWLIAPTCDGYLQGIDPDSGAAWSAKQGGQITAPLVEWRGFVVVAAITGKVHLLDPATGQRRTKGVLGAVMTTRPAVAPDAFVTANWAGLVQLWQPLGPLPTAPESP